MKLGTIRNLIMVCGFMPLIVLLTACGFGEQVAVSILNKQDLTQYEIRGNRIYLSGELNSRTPEKLKTVLISNPDVKTLVLTKMPGSLDDEALFPFARWIRANGYNTQLVSTSEIASGAVDLFVAGVERTMEKGAKVGVHSWSDGDQEAIEYPRNHSAHKMNASYIEDMLGTEEFYWFTIESAPADSLHWMNKQEIEKYKLLTQPSLHTHNETN